MTRRPSADGLRRIVRRRRTLRSRPSDRAAPRSAANRDLLALIAVSLPGLAALAALLFTWMQVGQTSKELRISEEGQITNRFNAAISNLGSQSLDIRLGGIYALRRIMQDSPRDHHAVVSVLDTFAQQHAGSSARSLQTEADEEHAMKADVHAAIGVLAKLPLERDSGEAVRLHLSNTDLRLLSLETPISLPGARMDGADLRFASLDGANLQYAAFTGANLEVASLNEVDLRGAFLTATQLDLASFKGADLRGVDMTCFWVKRNPANGDLAHADTCVYAEGAALDGADLRKAKMKGADLRSVSFKGADLRGADLTSTNLTHADFRGAKLAGVKLDGAQMTGAQGLPKES